ncbi:MAG: hypothetical protein JXJ04_25455 [Spirochaetales bacterium]|nr:hypothetical protein [Spirochaetales bacterium]
MFNATDDELTFAFAVCTGSTWFWIESESFPLPSGMNKDFIFDVTSKTYKSSLTNWENSTALVDTDDVKRLIFKINGPAGLEGSVFLDNIRRVK